MGFWDTFKDVMSGVPIVGGIVNGVISGVQGRKQREQEEAIAQRNFDYQTAYNQQIMQREDTAMQRAVDDYTKAGFSKLAALGNPSGAGGTMSVNQYTPDYSASSSMRSQAIQQFANAAQSAGSMAYNNAQRKLFEMQTEAGEAEIENKRILNAAQVAKILNENGLSRKAQTLAEREFAHKVRMDEANLKEQQAMREQQLDIANMSRETQLEVLRLTQVFENFLSTKDFTNKKAIIKLEAQVAAARQNKELQQNETFFLLEHALNEAKKDDANKQFWADFILNSVQTLSSEVRSWMNPVADVANNAIQAYSNSRKK